LGDAVVVDLDKSPIVSWIIFRGDLKWLGVFLTVGISGSFVIFMFLPAPTLLLFLLF